MYRSVLVMVVSYPNCSLVYSFDNGHYYILLENYSDYARRLFYSC